MDFGTRAMVFQGGTTSGALVDRRCCVDQRSEKSTIVTAAWLMLDLRIVAQSRSQSSPLDQLPADP